MKWWSWQRERGPVSEAARAVAEAIETQPRLGKLAPIWEKLSTAARVAALIMAGIEPK